MASSLWKIVSAAAVALFDPTSRDFVKLSWKDSFALGNESTELKTSLELREALELKTSLELNMALELMESLESSKLNFSSLIS